MSKPRASSFETSQPAASWFQSPAHWDNEPAARQLPDLGAFDQANKRARYDEENQDVGYFVPFIPVMQQGKESFLMPLMYLFDGVRHGHYQLDDAGMFSSIVTVMREVAARISCDYCVEYHKLEFEELGGQWFFAQHCHSVRGACILRQPDTGTRIAKAYLGMGTARFLSLLWVFGIQLSKIHKINTNYRTG